jgi:hypothetical protein
MKSRANDNPRSGRYRVAIEGDWLVKDFSDFFHYYSEVYSLYFLLLSPAIDPQRTTVLMSRYPWKGGYSAVNFYDDIYVAVGKSNRPRVAAIQFASPGTVDLILWLAVATLIARIVSQIAKTGHEINDLYHSIYTNLQQRKLLSLDVRERELDVTRRELEFIQSTYQTFAEALQVPNPKNFLETAPNPLAALKILLSLYRRVKKLAEFQVKGKAKF